MGSLSEIAEGHHMSCNWGIGYILLAQDVPVSFEVPETSKLEPRVAVPTGVCRCLERLAQVRYYSDRHSWLEHLKKGYVLKKNCPVLQNIRDEKRAYYFRIHLVCMLVSTGKTCGRCL